jgi:hypothetical protein
MLIYLLPLKYTTQWASSIKHKDSRTHVYKTTKTSVPILLEEEVIQFGESSQSIPFVISLAARTRKEARKYGKVKHPHQRPAYIIINYYNFPSSTIP